MNNLCVMMFSGGRDSTLGAIRLANSGKELVLVTVSSTHLKGISAVEKRLIELKPLLPGDTLWMHLDDSRLTAPALRLAQKTCLPCFLKYISLGVMIARQVHSSSLAFGFTTYQSAWIEQTPYAVNGLKKVLSEFGIQLETPVYDLKTKEAAIEELQTLGLSVSALEQKCSRQINNEEIASEKLQNAIDEWTKTLSYVISKNLSLDISAISQYNLVDFELLNLKSHDTESGVCDG